MAQAVICLHWWGMLQLANARFRAHFFTASARAVVRATLGCTRRSLMPLKKRTLFRVAGAMAALVLLAAITAIFVVRSAWFNGKVRQFIVGTGQKATGGRREGGQFAFAL